jgi:hypothetical protein
LKQPALAEAIRGFDLDVFRLQNLGKAARARALVQSEEETQILLKALEQDQLILSTFSKPPFWESRFRKSFEAGVFYAAQDIETAMAEVGFHRHQFLVNSPLLTTTTISMVSVAAHLNADLVDVELLQDPAIYSKDSYSESQALALRVREAGLPGLHYLSVRSKPRGSAFAIFSPEVLSSTKSPAKFFVVTITRDRVEFRSPDLVTEFDPRNWG